MTRDEATQRVLADVSQLVRYGNGAKLRDGSHTVEGLQARIRKELDRFDSLSVIFLAADLMKLAIERLTTEDASA